MTAPHLIERDRLLAATRKFFGEHGFTEVTTPVACEQVIPELHIEPVRTADGRFLQASPEMEMKRLVCHGSGPILQICPAFRADERGPLHRPEFTMIEWYRPGDDIQCGMDLLAEFVEQMLGSGPCRRTCYRDLFLEAFQFDPLTATRDRLKRAADESGVFVGTLELLKMDEDDWLNLLLSTKLEHRLGHETPELVYHYPASQAALARTTVDEHGNQVAERFELFYRGVELANGYHELTDAAELRKRLVQVNAQREADGRPALPLPEALLADMTSPGLPACAGVALGLDRLVMLALGADSIG